MKEFPRAWIGVLYGAIVWLPVFGSLYANIRDALAGRWGVTDWIVMLLLWAAGAVVWMFICDWGAHRIGGWFGWWPNSRTPAQPVDAEAEILVGDASAIREPQISMKLHSVPWDEVGAALGSQLLKDVSRLSEELTKTTPPLRELRQLRWRYELCLFHMFWAWYVATSPRLANANATKPFLDNYYGAAFTTLADAGLVTKETYAQWRRDAEVRFPAYKEAFERADPTGLRFYTGTVGYTFLRFLEPDRDPSGLAVIITELGSIIFQELAKYIEKLERGA